MYGFMTLLFEQNDQEEGKKIKMNEFTILIYDDK